MSRSPIRTARTPAPSACAAARNLAAMPPVATPPSILVSISAAARVGCVTPAIATPGTSETKSSSCAPNAAAIAAAAWSALTLSGRTGVASEGATGATTGVSPASRRLWSSDARTLTISPTSPRAVPFWSGCALSRPPSTPDNPIASRPAARNAVTSSRFIGPPRTISTSSAISGVVTRRPSRCSTGRPSRRDHVVTAWPPPCTTTTGPILLKARAHSATHAGRSSSLPPILTTRTFSMLDTLKSAPKESLPLRAVLHRAQALACVLARESRRFWEPEHHVHILDRLSRRALHEVVDRGDDGEARPAHVGNFRDADRHAVAVHDVLEGRQRAVHHLHAGLGVVGRAVEALGGRLIEHARQRHVNRFENAALHRQEMRREHEVARKSPLARQRLLQLGEMAVR